MQQLFEDAKRDPRNARTLSFIADTAYLPEAAGREVFQKEFGMQSQLLHVGNTQVYVATNDDHIVAAFRGTEAPTSIEGLKDWLLTDAVNLLIRPEGDLGTDFAAAGVGTRWHSGFIRALNEIWDPVFAAVTAARKQSDRPFWITGHSLGGALALLAAWRFKRKFVPVHQVYTFGAPMVGNSEAAKTIDREFGDKIYRYVNHQDPIPQLPTLSLLANQYGHCNTEVMLGAAAAAAGEAAGSTTSLFREYAGRAADGVLKGTLLDEFWKNIQQRIGAHAMKQYRGHIDELK
jgi:triacylglycerol lipase